LISHEIARIIGHVTSGDLTTRIDRAHSDRAAVDKAISLLVSFGDQAATGVGVSELARRSSLSKSTAFRVLGMLERNGVVERIGREYRLGARLHELGRSVYAPGHHALRDELTPFLVDLYEATHETVHLVTLHGADVLVLGKLYGHRRVPSPSRVGGLLPAHATAGGKAMLAYDPDAFDLVRQRDLAPLTSATVVDPEALAGQLADVRVSGVARETGEVTAGVACLAAPVFGPGRKPVAALSVSVPANRLDQRRLEPLLRQVACGASRAVVHATVTPPAQYNPATDRLAG
jgi:DNA-binding IclR family transcriptional regulator